MGELTLEVVRCRICDRAWPLAASERVATGRARTHLRTAHPGCPWYALAVRDAEAVEEKG